MAQKVLHIYDTGITRALETVAEENGGTGKSSYSVGDILYADGATSLAQLPIGPDGYVLTCDSGVPTWQSPPGLIPDVIDIIRAGKIDALTAGVTRYLLPDFSESNTEDFIAYLVDGYGDLTGLRIQAGTAPGMGESIVFTVRVNGADTILTATLSDLNTDVTDDLHTVSVLEGDRITIKAVSTGGSVAADINVNVKLTQSPHSIIEDVIDVITVGKAGVLANATRYLLPMFAEANNENFAAYVIQEDGVLDRLIAYVNTACGVGQTLVLTVRVNGVDTSLVTTIANADNYGYDFANFVNVSAGDLVTVRSVNSGGSIAADLYVAIRYIKTA